MPPLTVLQALKSICKDLRRKSRASAAEARGTGSVASDIDQLLAPKSYEQLETLEVQVKRKLDSDEPIDYDYWEQLLRSLRVWKAKAKLRRVSQEIVKERLQALRTQQAEAAASVQSKTYDMLKAADAERADGPTAVAYDAALDPQPLLKLRAEDKGLVQTEETAFLEDLARERYKTQKLGYVPMQNTLHGHNPTENTRTASQAVTTSASRFAPVEKEDYSQATMALYEREVARGVEDGEEIFTAEEEVATARPQWAGDYKPRKPRYFNRVQMGYEWNKYNQTHYDHDNPPPKVVQGYKFNIFYPDLIDKAKAPTYKIERENGRKRGQSFAPAGEDDTCLIRFIAGPPYQDVAFRIIDKEWDYSAKRERGFKSSFDKVSPGSPTAAVALDGPCPLFDTRLTRCRAFYNSISSSKRYVLVAVAQMDELVLTRRRYTTASSGSTKLTQHTSAYPLTESFPIPDLACTWRRLRPHEGHELRKARGLIATIQMKDLLWSQRSGGDAPTALPAMMTANNIFTFSCIDVQSPGSAGGVSIAWTMTSGLQGCSQSGANLDRFGTRAIQLHRRLCWPGWALCYPALQICAKGCQQCFPAGRLPPLRSEIHHGIHTLLPSSISW
jgi:hypothetical protein